MEWNIHQLWLNHSQVSNILILKPYSQKRYQLCNAQMDVVGLHTHVIKLKTQNVAIFTDENFNLFSWMKTFVLGLNGFL